MMIPRRTTDSGKPFRVLCYSPYNAWQLHAMWEMTLVHALRVRGVDVHYLFCDALYSDCDLHWKAAAPRKPNSCLTCQSTVTNLAAQMGVDYNFFGRYTTPDHFSAARKWADSVQFDSISEATYLQWPIGDWAQSSIHQHFRTALLDLEDPEILAGCRSYLYSVLVAAFAARRTLDILRPDALLLFNGKFSNIRPFKEMALERGIRVVGHERGLLRNSLRMFTEHDSDAMSQFSQMWALWKDIPLLTLELEAIIGYLRDRRYGKNLTWHAFGPPPSEDSSTLRTQLGLTANATTWVMYPSSDDETAAAKERHNTFGQQDLWIEKTLRFVEKHPEIQLVIRAHPNIKDHNRGMNQRQYKYFQDLKQQSPENVYVVMPEEDVSSYSLFDIADLGLVYNSTIGIEMAADGMPVIMATNGWYYESGFVQSATDPDHYQSLLEKNLRSEIHQDRQEIRRGALRFAYGAYFRLMVPFPLVEQVNPRTGKPTYRSLEELFPGKDPGLDRVCRMILEGESVIPIPSKAERIRDTVEENEGLSASVRS